MDSQYLALKYNRFDFHQPPLQNRKSQRGQLREHLHGVKWHPIIEEDTFSDEIRSFISRGR